MSPKTWFITGASQGLGRVVTERVLEAGHNVVATMRKPEVFQSLQQQYPSERLLVLALDVTDPVQVEDAFAKAKESVKRIDVVFNNAGTCLVGDAEAVPNDVAKSLMEVNFWGAVHVSKAAVAFFRDVNQPSGGHLIQNSSVCGVVGIACMGFYSATKFALEGYSEALSKEVNPSWNIKITILEAALFRTNLLDIGATTYRHPAYLSDPNSTSNQMSALFEASAKDHTVVKGDPAKFAECVMKLVDIGEKQGKAPLRVLLLKDAWAAYEQNEEAGRKEREEYGLKSWSDDIEFTD